MLSWPPASGCKVLCHPGSRTACSASSGHRGRKMPATEIPETKETKSHLGLGQASRALSESGGARVVGPKAAKQDSCRDASALQKKTICLTWLRQASIWMDANATRQQAHHTLLFQTSFDVQYRKVSEQAVRQTATRNCLSRTTSNCF